MEQNIKDITNFIFLEIKPVKKGIVIIPGTYRPQIVKKAYEVYLSKKATFIITTGGISRPEYDVYESEYQRDYLVKKGVPKEIIYIETKSTNTKENAVEAMKIAKKHKLDTSHIILVSKTYHARRIYMTYRNVFVGSDISLVTAVDERKITKNNWYKNRMKKEKVMEEVEKIGKYFLKGDLSI